MTIIKDQVPKKVGWAKSAYDESQKILVDPPDKDPNGKRYNAWARTRFASAKATEWRLVGLPFPVDKHMIVKWPNRLGWGTKYEPSMEYRPVDGQWQPNE